MANRNEISEQEILRMLDSLDASKKMRANIREQKKNGNVTPELIQDNKELEEIIVRMGKRILKDNKFFSLYFKFIDDTKDETNGAVIERYLKEFNFPREEMLEYLAKLGTAIKQSSTDTIGAMMCMFSFGIYLGRQTHEQRAKTDESTNKVPIELDDKT